MARIAFWCALTSFLIFLVTIVAGGAGFPGYSHGAQYISELGAIGAPHSQIVSWFGFIPSGILLMTFAFVAPLTLPRSPWTWLGFSSLGFYAFGLVVGGLFPCDFGCRPDEQTAAQLIHNAVVGIGYLVGITALLVLGVQARKWAGGKHLLPLGVTCWLLAACSLPALDPGFEYAGIAQRIIEVSMYTWIIACAFYVRRTGMFRPDGSLSRI